MKTDFQEWRNKGLMALVLLLAALSAKAELVLNGTAQHMVSGNVRFVAGLYVTTKSDNAMAVLRANEDKRMRLVIRAPSLELRVFRKTWTDSLAANAGPQDLQKYAEALAEFTNLFGADLKRDDEIVIDRTRGGVRISMNGTALGHLADPMFFDFLLRSWIGPVPLSQSVRESLLGGTKTDAQLVALLNDAEKRSATSVKEQAAEATAPQLAHKEPMPIVAPPAVEKIALKPAELETPAAPKLEPVAVAIDDAVHAAKQSLPNVGSAVAATESAPAAVASKGPVSSPVKDKAAAEPVITAERLLKEQLYIVELRKAVQKKLEYPEVALSRGWKGSVRAQITVDRAGKVRSVEIEEPAKYDLLTDAVSKAIKRAVPFPGIPAELGSEEFTFSLPVNFDYEEKLADRR